MIQYVEHITPEEYMTLRKRVGWMQFPLEEARNCVENAYMVICVRDDEKAIGVVRLLWDGGYVAFLSDVIVDPDYQGQGIGRTLVEAVIKRIKDGIAPEIERMMRMTGLAARSGCKPADTITASDGG